MFFEFSYLSQRYEKTKQKIKDILLALLGLLNVNIGKNNSNLAVFGVNTLNKRRGYEKIIMLK